MIMIFLLNMLFSYKKNFLLLLSARIFRISIIIQINTDFLEEATFDLNALVLFYIHAF